MLARLAADLTLIVHAAFVAAVVLGGVAWLRWRWAPWLHLPMAAWGAWVEIAGRLCPLTVIENRLREAAGSAGYGGGFIEHYLLAALYPEGLDRNTQLLLGAGVIAINLAIYFWVWRRRRARSAHIARQRRIEIRPRTASISTRHESKHPE
ncbi:MAG: DUF2784 domain-containing protein [Pseudomonadales bacterium]